MEFQYPIDPLYRRWLVLSSSLFFLPAALAFTCYVSILGSFSLLTALASVQFWLYGKKDWRWIVDKTTAYATFLLYCWTGFRNVQHTWMLLYYLILVTTVVLSYQMSCYKWRIGCPSWVQYHVTFHICLTVGKMMVIVANSDTC